MLRFLDRVRRALDTRWSDRLDGLRRDLDGVLGRTASSPAIRSGATAARAAASLTATRWLTVREVVRETADSVSLYFERAGLETWRPGEFLTVHVVVAGQRLRRAYSLCTRPADPRGPAITIKRVPGGIVSPHLVEHAAPGMRLEVRGPSGQFLLAERAAGRPRHVVFIGGGSGITPLVALAEEVLAQGDRATLLYGNRSLADVIFRDRLAALAADSGGRLALRHVLETPPPDWTGLVGRLDREAVAAELAALERFDAIYSCGPAPMMDAVRAAAAALGLDRAPIHEERFQSLAQTRARTLPGAPQPLTIALAGATHQVLARPGATILEAALAAGVPLPHSCTMGGCGACRVRLRGEVAHDTPNGLSPEEEAAGYAFACIARPLGPCAVEVAPL